MKHFKQFMKDLETTPTEESTEEEVEPKGEAKEEDEIKTTTNIRGIDVT